jgi:hypothetical protein
MRDATPVGRAESRHVTQLREGDLVWDVALRRWRRVTSTWRYTTECTGQDMVKIVLDMSAFHRIAAGDDARYDVLLDDRPEPSVAPLSATERRRELRRRGRDDDDTPESEPTDVDATSPADPTTPPVAAEPALSASSAAPGQVVQASTERARREALGLSRADLARLTGLTVGALWRVENGRPKSDELARLHAALESEENRHASH